MAKKKYRISKPNVLGGSVSSNKNTIPVMANGGQAATDQDQMQAFMLSVYNLFKEGMTEEDVELQLTSQNIPYDFVQKAITTVKNYMESIGEINDPVAPNTNFSGIETPEPSEEESALKQNNDQLMASYGEQSQKAALEEDEDDLIFQDNPYMKKGGKVSRKKFMKNILKRFEEGGAESPVLKSGSKKDTLEKDVEKATKGFTSAVQGKAKEALSKEIYKLSEQSGDPKLQQMLMSDDQQQQPMQPMAREGMMVNGDDELLLYGSKKTQPVDFIEGNTDLGVSYGSQTTQPIDGFEENTDLGIPYGSQTTTPVDGFEDNTDLKYGYGGMQPMAREGMQYGEKGVEMRKQIKNNPKKGQHLASFLMNNPIPTEEEEVNIKIDPEYGDVVYKDKYVNMPYQSYGLRDLLFPANRSLGYRPKYYVDRSLGKPVARDVYGRTLFGGKKYIDYYEMPDEDFDPEILRRKDINKRAREGNRAIRRTLRGKGPIADALDKVLNRDDAGNDMGVDATEEVVNETPSYTRRELRDMRRKLNPNPLKTKLNEIYYNNSFNKPVDAVRNIFGFEEGGQTLDAYALGGFDPTSMFQIRQNIDDEVNRQLDDPNFYENNQKIIDETFEGPQPYEEYEDNMEGPPMLDKKKKKIIGIENKDKMGIMGGQEFLNPFNATSNRVLGGLENVQSSKAANKTIVNSTDPMNMYKAETRGDKGDFDIYGNFRPDEQGFIGSTNNPGMTMSKYGGPTYQKGAIVEMDANELQQFMEAGGQIEFL